MSTVVRMADVFNRAAELLDVCGWVQGQYVAPGGYCLLGATFEAANDLTGLDGGARRLERSDLYARLQAVTTELPHRWNDNKGRTKEAVQEALRDAARQSGDETIDWGAA